ncbi:MAG: hypothetical protein ACTSPE_11915 [Candidatus Thorarchaeota archaeon]
MVTDVPRIRIRDDLIMGSQERALPEDPLEHWICSPTELAEELRAFTMEFGSFTPELFAEVKFHLLRASGLTKRGRDELCEVSISEGLCTGCSLLYATKKCLLWYRLYKQVEWRVVERAPPCIRLAYVRRNIRTVVNYLTAAGLLDPPFYPSRRAPSCRMMRRWGLCEPNEYCRAMRTGNTLEYIPARERVKLFRAAPSRRNE